MTTAITPKKFYIGIDLGQANDFTSILVMSPNDNPEPTYNLGHIERVPLQTRYPAIVAHIGRLVNSLRNQTPKPDVTVILDYTGVGRPVADMMVDANYDCELVLVTITGGDTVSRGELGEFRVPKRDLASSIQRLLQEGRLIMPAEHPMTETFSTELTGFRVKINLRGHDSYGAGDDWRSAQHDDLVLGLAVACWYAESGVRGGDEIVVYYDPVSISPV